MGINKTTDHNPYCPHPFLILFLCYSHIIQAWQVRSSLPGKRSIQGSAQNPSTDNQNASPEMSLGLWKRGSLSFQLAKTSNIIAIYHIKQILFANSLFSRRKLISSRREVDDYAKE